MLNTQTCLQVSTNGTELVGIIFACLSLPTYPEKPFLKVGKILGMELDAVGGGGSLKGNLVDI